MRPFVSLLLIRLIIPQTSSNNVVVSRFSDIGFFASYAEAKSIVFILTWVLILIVLLLHTFVLHVLKHVRQKFII